MAVTCPCIFPNDWWWRKPRNKTRFRKIAYSVMPDGSVLSTVLNSILDKENGLFESIWFGGIHDGETQRYFKESDAILGHQQMIIWR